MSEGNYQSCLLNVLICRTKRINPQQVQVHCSTLPGFLTVDVLPSAGMLATSLTRLTRSQPCQTFLRSAADLGHFYSPKGCVIQLIKILAKSFLNLSPPSSFGVKVWAGLTASRGEAGGWSGQASVILCQS